MESFCGVCYNPFKNNIIECVLKCQCKENLCDFCIQILTMDNQYKCPYCRQINYVTYLNSFNDNIDIDDSLEVNENDYNNEVEFIENIEEEKKEIENNETNELLRIEDKIKFDISYTLRLYNCNINLIEKYENEILKLREKINNLKLVIKNTTEEKDKEFNKKKRRRLYTKINQVKNIIKNENKDKDINYKYFLSELKKLHEIREQIKNKLEIQITN